MYKFQSDIQQHIYNYINNNCHHMQYIEYIEHFLTWYIYNNLFHKLIIHLLLDLNNDKVGFDFLINMRDKLIIILFSNNYDFYVY